MTSPYEAVGTVEIVDSIDTIEYDIDAGLVRATYDGDRDSATLAVVAVIAAADNSDPTELTPLHLAVDTSALDALFSPTAEGIRRSGRTSFQYEGYAVTVSSEGTVEASPVA